MCGVCGFIDYSAKKETGVLTGMVNSLRHRGPDDNGCEIMATRYASIGLGHSRFAVIDTTMSGHQPMHYGDLSIVLNGEIYNFKEIRKDLRGIGHSFISESDIEVVLHAFSEWGISCIQRFIGMFVIVIFNKSTREIIISRDRGGVKPIFYYWYNELFLFSPELKAFHLHPIFIKEINLNAVHQYMDFGYVPSPNCIFKHCNKLNPCHFLTFKVDNREIKITKNWDIKDYYMAPNLNISYNDAKTEIENLLYSAFEYRMVSDVPVGVFLSGGYDSTAEASILDIKAQNIHDRF